MGTFFDIQKQYAIWLKFGVSQRDEIFIDTKCKVCHMVENLSLSIDIKIFSLWRFSIFHQVLPYMHCNAGFWSNHATVSLDVCCTNIKESIYIS